MEGMDAEEVHNLATNGPFRDHPKMGYRWNEKQVKLH